MADGAEFSSNINDVLKRFQKMTDVTKNFMPLWSNILGKVDSTEPWTLRGGTKFNLEAEKGPKNETWPQLRDKYAAWKAKHYAGGMPMLHLSGSLYLSLVTTTEHSVVAPTPLKLSYGTTLPYAASMQFSNPRWHAYIRRPYLGFRAGQAARIKLEIRKYLFEAYGLKSGGVGA